MSKIHHLLKNRWLTMFAGLGLAVLGHQVHSSQVFRPFTGSLSGSLLGASSAMLTTNPVWPNTSELLRGGTRIRLNQQTIAADWLEWRSPQTKNPNGPGSATHQFGVAEQTLRQQFGAKLISNDQADLQPIEWFGSQNLAPQVTNQTRYLALDTLATEANWQWQVQGDVLTIETPMATVQSVRWSPQAWGQRIVVELDHPIVWQAQQSAQAVQLTLLNTQLPTATSSESSSEALPFTLTANSTATTATSTAQQANLRIPLQGQNGAMSAQFGMLNEPPRLVVDLTPAAPPQGQPALTWVPGLSWQKDWLWLDDQYFPVTYLTVDPTQAELEVRPLWHRGATIAGITPLMQLAPQWGAIAAINGGFFNRNNQLPLGALRVDDQWLSGPILNRGAVAWNDQGQFQFERVTLQEQLLTDLGVQVPVLYLNSGYVKAGFARYTSAWGATYTPLTDNETLFVIESGNESDQVSQILTSGKAGTQQFPIPVNGYLLTARATPGAAQQLPLGSRLQLRQQLYPQTLTDYPHMLGGGPLLVRDRQIVLNPQTEAFSTSFARQGAVRSAIAALETGEILLLTVHPSTKGKGPTLAQWAELLQNLGAVNALNLDGGSSSSLYLGGTLLNREPRTAARVQNALGIFIAAPE
ncbi:MAG: phosphodiester glycosidase family protein [Cyanobacteria bacterium P01_H01_bin.121]